MTALYNYFSATFTDVLHEFQGAPLAAFDSVAGADGQAQIETKMDVAERVVLAHLPPDYRALLDRVEYEVVESFADEGQASVSLSFTPAASPRIRVWKNWPGAPLLPTGAYELTDGVHWQQAVSPTTQIDFLAGHELSRGDQIICSYTPGSTWSVPILAATVVQLARDLLAARLYRADDPGAHQAATSLALALKLLEGIRDGRVAVPTFDRLTLVADRTLRSVSRTATKPLGRA